MGTYRILEIDVDPLVGAIDYEPFSDSYIARVYHNLYDCKDGLFYLNLIGYSVFGNGIYAENWLLDQLEYPAWTLLKSQE